MKKLIIFLLLIFSKVNHCLPNMILKNKTNQFVFVEFQAEIESSYIIDTKLIEPNHNYIQLKGNIINIIIYVYDNPNIENARLLQEFSDIQNPNTGFFIIEEKGDEISIKKSLFSTKI